MPANLPGWTWHSNGWTRYIFYDGDLVDLGPRDIRALAVTPDGAVWMGTCGLGLYRYDGERLTRYTTADGLITDDPFPLALAPDGALWVSSGGMVTRFDGSPNFVKTGTYEMSTGPGGNVFSIAPVPDGGLWFATWNQLFYFDESPGLVEQNAAWTTYTAEDTSTGYFIQTIDVAPDGALWGCCVAGSLFRFDGNRWDTFRADSMGGNVQSIAVAPDGRVWVGTDGGGVLCFDGQHWTTYMAEDGLGSDYVDTVAVAPDGTIWASAHGVFCFRDAVWSRCGMVVDWAIEGFSSMAAAPDGALWFGDMYGLYRFLPEE